MPRGPRFTFKNSTYHIYNRGLDKQQIFLNEKDYNFFINRLRKLHTKFDHSVYACVLMPNHFHLIIRTRSSPVSKIMASLLTSYSMYFNKRHQHFGPIWQNRFQSILIENDYYLFQLLKYVYLNPLGNLAPNPLAYSYSTYAEALGQKPLMILDQGFRELLDRNFKSVDEFRNFIEADLIDTNPKIEQVFEKESAIVGGSAFFTRANRKYLRKLSNKKR